MQSLFASMISPILILFCIIIFDIIVGAIIVGAIIAIVFTILSDKKSNHSTYIPKERTLRHTTQSEYIQERKNITGRLGELHVSSIIGDSAFGRRYVFNDVLLKNGSRTSQIDHILVNRAGVFSIETKKISGAILGSMDSDKWTQWNKREQRTFYNPIKQNETHIRIIKEIIGEKYPVFSLIVFVNDNKPIFSSDIVVNMSEFRSALIEKSRAINLSSEEIENVSSLIREHISHSAVEREKHIEMAKQTKNALDAGRCPRCNRKLVIKKGRFGEFWACSGYPSCSYTKNI